MFIKINNYKVIKSFEYEINKITVFTGDNGTGKTTNSDYLFDNLNKNNSYLLDKLLSEYLKKSKSNNSISKNLLSSLISYQKGSLRELLESYFDNSKDFEYLLSNMGYELFEEYLEQDNDLYEFIDGFKSFYFNKIDILTDSQENNITKSEIDKVVYITEDALAYQKMFSGNKTSPLGMLKKFVDNPVGDEDLKENDISLQIEKLTDIKVENEFRKKYLDSDQNSFRWNELSSGTKILTLLNEILQNGHLSYGTLLILDEPENHLQPKWQIEFAQMIVELVDKQKIRVVINSHSPFFVQAIEVYSKKKEIKPNYYYCKKQDSKCTCIDVTNNKVKIYSELAEAFETLAREGQENV